MSIPYGGIMEENRYTVEQLITGFYIKYNRLTELINAAYSNSARYDNVDLYIDLHSVLKNLYSGNIWTYKSTNGLDIASTIINMCAHYRAFFKKRQIKNTRIFLIYGLNCPDANKIFVENYNGKFIRNYRMKPTVTNSIENNLNIVDLICQYLPGIYFFDIGKAEVSSMIHKLVTTIPSIPDCTKIVITKDILPLQLLSEGYVDAILKPHKVSGADLSDIVTIDNLWDKYCTVYRNCKIPDECVSVKYLSNIMCMTSVPERCIYTVYRVKKAMELINLAIQNKYIQPDTVVTQFGLNTALSILEVPNIGNLELRYRAICPKFQSQYMLPSEKPEYKKSVRLIDLEDISGLKDVVSRYFDTNPIQIDRL